MCFFGVASLVNEMLAANHELRLSKLTAQLVKLDLVVLDELGFIPFTKEGSQLLFQLSSDLNDRVSVMSQLICALVIGTPFSETIK